MVPFLAGIDRCVSTGQRPTVNRLRQQFAGDGLGPAGTHRNTCHLSKESRGVRQTPPHTTRAA